MSSSPYSSAVFLHAFWRTGSTWLWSCFRELEETICYYEPFHPLLASFVDSDLDGLAPGSWNSGHSPNAPYFLEYRELLHDGGGVRDFSLHAPVENFFPAGKLDAADRAYLTTLIEHARAAHRQPVLGFCRSLGRVGAMRNALGGHHAILLREPFSVLNSVLTRGFLRDYVEIALATHNRSVLTKWGMPLARFRLPDPEMVSTPDWVDGHPYSAASLMLHVYLFGCFAGLLYADETLVIERLSEDIEYNAECGARLRDLTGLKVDLSNCSSPNRFDGIQPYHLALDSLTRSLNDSLFSRPNELAEQIARTEGIAPINDPTTQMALLAKLFRRSGERLTEDRTRRGVPLARTSFDACQFLETAFAPVVLQHESLVSDSMRLKHMERTLSWRLTRPLRLPLFNRLRRWFDAST